MVTEQIIIDALKTIRGVCISHEYSCVGCPFHKDGWGCMIQHIAPYDWKLSGLPKEEWKAFAND